MQGILVNKTDNNGRTGLHYACINGLNSVVHLLLNFPGIQVDIPDIGGNTPLHLAILGFESTLLYYGRKVNIIEAILHNRLPLLMTRNSNGDTPYQIALRKKEKLDNYSLVRKKRIGVIEKLEHWTHVVRVLEDATKRLRMQMFLYFLEYN
jgi:ankyrin repeat protein